MRRALFVGATGLLVASAVIAGGYLLASWPLDPWPVLVSVGLTLLAVSIGTVTRDALNTLWRIRRDLADNSSMNQSTGETVDRIETAHKALAERQNSTETAVEAIGERQAAMYSLLAETNKQVIETLSSLSNLQKTTENGVAQQQHAREQLAADLEERTQDVRAFVDRSTRTTSDTVKWAAARIEREQLFSYRQIAALANLLSSLDLDAPLAPMRNTWAIAPDSAAFLIRTIFEERPHLVLELGSGLSTVLIAKALEQIGSGRLVSVDHDEEYARQTQTMLATHGLEDSVDLVVAPLTVHEIKEETWTWYDTSNLAESSTFDFVVVDGPPGTTGPLARYPAVPILMDRLAPGALLFLDDASRDDEREVLSRWLSDHGGESLPVPELEKGGALMRIVKSTPSADPESPGLTEDP